MHQRIGRNTALVAALVLAVGCSGPSKPPPAEQPTGSARFVVATSQALTAEDVARVDVTLDAFDISPNTIPLVKDGEVWVGTMSSIRAGDNRRFHAEAFDSNDVKIYEGEVSGVTILDGETAQVNILAQQVNRPPPFQNESPVIDSLVVSRPSVEPGSTLSLKAAAHDPNPGDTLTFAWTATDGTFSAPSALESTWTAPATTGSVTLTFTATDQHGAASAISFTVQVEVVGRGNADVTVSFNSWPLVASMNATPTQVRVNQPLTATAVVEDPDAVPGTISYTWSASCDGTWTNGSSASATFTPTKPPASTTCNNCELTVTVTDGRGGVNTGKLAICVSGTVTPDFPPQVASVYQSSASVKEGDVVRLRVNATDSRGRPLTFQWSSNVGMLGQPSTNTAGTTGEVHWTAPSCLSSGVTPTVTVRMATASTPELYTDHTFTLAWGSTGKVCSGTEGNLCFDASSDYLAHWTFDTTKEDSSIWDNDLGEFDTDPFISPGVWGEAAWTQGRYLARRAEHDPEFNFGTGAFTLSMWVNLTYSDMWLLSKAGGDGSWSLRSYYGRLYLYVNGANFEANRSFSANAWHHIAVTRDEAGQLLFYIDGQLAGTHSFPNALSDNSVRLTVGARGDGSYPLSGMLDELVILQRAATPLELASLVSKSCR